MIKEENYYDLNNRGLSQSKIKLYDLCPNYFYRSCITGDVASRDNKNFMIGREVDSILTEMDKFQNTIISPYDDFRTKEAREWKIEQEDKGKTVVKESEYEKIMAIAISVQETKVWKEIEKNYITQDILIKPDNNLGPHFDCLYGKPDAYKIDKDGICDLLDLKTSVTIDKRKFFYRAVDLGYFKQLWQYSDLLKYKHPEIKGFRYWFVVAEKSEPYRTVVFTIPNKWVERQENDMIQLISLIANDKDFKKKEVTFDNAITLSPGDNDNDEDEWEEQ